MIRLGFGIMNISAGFGMDLSFKANIKGIRSAIGMDVTEEEKTGIIAPGTDVRYLSLKLLLPAGSDPAEKMRTGPPGLSQ